MAEEHERGDVDVIDVRMPTEFREVHAELARNVPLDSLDPNAVMAARNGSAGEPLYVICRSGNRSAQACKKFIDAGFENVVNVEGGTTAWEKARLPRCARQEGVSFDAASSIDCRLPNVAWCGAGVPCSFPTALACLDSLELV